MVGNINDKQAEIETSAITPAKLGDCVMKIHNAIATSDRASELDDAIVLGLRFDVNLAGLLIQ